MKLILNKNGELLQNQNIVNKPLKDLFDLNIELDKDVTLNSVFQMVNKYIDLPNAEKDFENCFISEYVNHYNSLKEIPNYDSDPRHTNIEYLNLCWTKDSEDEDEIEYLSMDGHSFVLTEDINEHQVKGSRIEYSLSFLDYTSLLDIPLKLQPNIKIFYGNNKVEEGIKETTVFDFIYSIFYELSFYGSPEDTQKESESFKKTVEEFKRGEGEFIRLRDLKEFNDFFKDLDS